MKENEVAKIIVDAAYKIHTKLGPGLLESVYKAILAYELQKRGLSVEREQRIPIVWENVRFEEGFRADLVVESSVIVELKSVEKTVAVHKKQLLTQIRLADMQLALLINFGEELIRNGIKRVVNGLAE